MLEDENDGYKLSINLQINRKNIGINKLKHYATREMDPEVLFYRVYISFIRTYHQIKNVKV